MLIYTAGPFFSEKQVVRIKKLEELLESKGFKVYSPRRDGIKLNPNSSKEDREQVYKENIDNVLGCDMIVSDITDKDTGTCVEWGVKIAQYELAKRQLMTLQKEDPDLLTERDKVLLHQDSPRIISFSETGGEINIMLLGAVIKHCKSWDELSKYMDHVKEVGHLKLNKDEDSIMSVNIY